MRVPSHNIMKIKTNTILTISSTFGSEFQKEFGDKSLVGAITAWRDYLNSSHKDNDIKISIKLATKEDLK